MSKTRYILIDIRVRFEGLNPRLPGFKMLIRSLLRLDPEERYTTRDVMMWAKAQSTGEVSKLWSLIHTSS